MAAEKGDTMEMKPLQDGGGEKGEAKGARNEQALHGSLTLHLLFAVTVCAVGSSFQFGYNTGVVNAPAAVVRQWIYESHNRTFHEEMRLDYNTLIWSITVSIFAIGGMIGGLMSGMVADKFGRKGGMLLNNIFAFIAAALMGFSKVSGVYYLLILGRFVVGFNSGLNSGLAPMYLTEVGPVNLRGALGSVHQLMVTISILISQILGLKFLLGNEHSWPFLFGMTRKDLKKLRGRPDVGVELEDMQEECNKMKAVPKVKFFDMFVAPLRWPLFIAVMMMMSQQFSGINVAIYYSTNIFTGAGLSTDTAVYATLGMGAINVAMTVVSMVIVDRAGRRTLHLAGLGGMWVCSILLVIMLVLQEDKHKWASALCVILVLAFVVSFATGPGSIPWFFVSELFMQGSRGHANSIAVMTNWMANFIVGLIFLPLKDAINMYSFLLFTFFLTVFWLFTWKFVPETKGVPIEEIVAKFEQRR